MGTQTVFEIVVHNTGDTILNNVSVGELSFDGLIFDSFIDYTGLWNFKSSILTEGLLGAPAFDLMWTMNMPLYVGEQAGFFVLFNSTGTGIFTNNVLATSDNAPDALANASVEVVVPEYTIDKITVNKTVTIGDKVYFEILVHNTGKVDISDLTVVENPGLGLEFDSFIDSAGLWLYNNNLTWTLNGSLKPNEYVGFFVIFKTTKTGVLNNSVSAGNKSASSDVLVTDMQLNNTVIHQNSTDDDNESDGDENNLDDDDKNDNSQFDNNYGVGNRHDIKLKGYDTGNPVLIVLLSLFVLFVSRIRKVK